MPTELLLIGPPSALAQNIVYALPARAVRAMALASCEISVDGQTWVTATGINTTGVDVASGFVRCTGGATTLFLKAY